jgi:hypothetical protein
LELRGAYRHREIVNNWKEGWAGIAVLLFD